MPFKLGHNDSDGEGLDKGLNCEKGLVSYSSDAIAVDYAGFII